MSWEADSADLLLQPHNLNNTSMMHEEFATFERSGFALNENSTYNRSGDLQDLDSASGELPANTFGQPPIIADRY